MKGLAAPLFLSSPVSVMLVPAGQCRENPYNKPRRGWRGAARGYLNAYVKELF